VAAGVVGCRAADPRRVRTLAAMSESSSAAARLELVTIPDCRLCDRAREALTRLAEQRGQVWAERDLTELGAPDPMWWEQVPLVLVEGQVVCYWDVDEAAVVAALER